MPGIIRQSTPIRTLSIDNSGIVKLSLSFGLEENHGDVTHLSIEDLLREDIKCGVVLNNLMLEYINKKLKKEVSVNGSTIIKLLESVFKKREKDEFVTEEFPRTIDQVRNLDELLNEEKKDGYLPGRKKEPLTLVRINNLISEKQSYGRLLHTPYGICWYLIIRNKQFDRNNC